MDRRRTPCTAADRTAIETCLETASFAMWEARRGLDDLIACDTKRAAWRTYLRTAIAALETADEITSRYLTGAKQEC